MYVKGDINWFLLLHNLTKLHLGVTMNMILVYTCTFGKYSWRVSTVTLVNSVLLMDGSILHRR